jgi:hypothetical protein
VTALSAWLQIILSGPFLADLGIVLCDLEESSKGLWIC